KLDGGALNVFVARSVNTTGGGIALGAKNNVAKLLPADLSKAFQLAAGTAPPPSQLGTKVTIDNLNGTSGAIAVGNPKSATLNLTGSTNQTATLFVRAGAMTFNLGKPATSNEIKLEGGSFSVYKPIAYRPSTDGCADEEAVPAASIVSAQVGRSTLLSRARTRLEVREAGPSVLHDGHVLVIARGAVQVEASGCLITANAGSVLLISNEDGVVAVRNLGKTRSQSASLTAFNRVTELHSGQEVLIGPDRALVTDFAKSDKVGRRNLEMHEIDSTCILARSDVSFVTL